MKINSLESKWLSLWLHPTFTCFWFLNMGTSTVSFNCCKCSIGVYLFWTHKIHFTFLRMWITETLFHEITTEASLNRLLSSLLNILISWFLFMLKSLSAHQMTSLGVMDFLSLGFCANFIVVICWSVAKVALKFVFAVSVLFSGWVQIAFFVHIIIDLRSHFFIYCLCSSCFWNMLLNIISMENWIMPRGRIHLRNVLSCFIFFMIMSFIRL